MHRTIGLILWLFAAFVVTVPAPAHANMVIFDDALAAGWQDWSWGGITRDFNHAAPVHAGTAAIAVTFTAGWSGFQLGYWQALDVSAYDTLRLYVHGGASGGQTIQISTGDSNLSTSVTQDVTSVYARRSRNRIHYRVVDEYEGSTLSGRCTRTSARPLTLGELESFFNGAWSIFDVLAMNFGHRGYDRDLMLDFVVGVESPFYPLIGQLYERRIETWGAALRETPTADVGR